jgi:Rab GDP dissociation inhibitor
LTATGPQLPLLQLFERFRPGQKPPAELGPSRDYNVDLVPKFIMVGAALQ